MGHAGRPENRSVWATLRDMYTRCPQCQTLFAITRAQLSERDGVVRCGHCDKVFFAEESLSLDLDKVPATPPVEVTQAAQPASETKKDALFTKKFPLSGSRFIKTTSDELAAIKAKLLGRKPGRHTRPVFWSLGIGLLTLLLFSQYVYFHKEALARNSKWGPYVYRACKIAKCVIRPRQDVGLIELTDTLVAPHPEYERALRVRTTLINRASFGQPYPLMEISLTNRRGETSGRRTYSPEEYLGKKKLAAKLMPQNVAIKTLLDIANPGDQTEGYEIRLVTY
ncbi:MAG: hypothetical protein BMS9Abin33_0010 [Gammaproteobacteria bacterium]|nr:MAG: hypothetical protein BMS9Abin33_0010 [Gammaproteobacteria bacterium]